MFFGSTTFAQAPFSDIGSSTVSPIVILSGNRLNISIGNITTLPEQLIGVTGQQFSVGRYNYKHKFTNTRTSS
jgi:hypothetical protein